jgi:hypothetical protein
LLDAFEKAPDVFFNSPIGHRQILAHAVLSGKVGRGPCRTVAVCIPIEAGSV